ncbi:hypothetical protein IWQ62_006011 [Dispira parvispora]|uniref:Late embryogenesis abundant protein LEA-2 subgroup domain-containing protein n=1 Tax=Dispira parvispora TaxID=1520584 RepID=A0A9W8AIL7_9FUNG|nr:hypothetical protein IWQ62_006011 [Dispira parvispora]
MEPKPQNDKDEPLGRYKRRRCCCCSMCCCCVITVVVVLVLVAVGLLLFFLLARMPTVKVVDVQPPSDGRSLFSTQGSSLVFNFDIRFDVDNPNYLTLGVNQLEGTGYWPSLPDVPMGNGTLRDITIEKQATTTLNFPVTLTYDPSKDPQHKVFDDLMDKCGFTGTRSQLTVDYEVKVYFKIIGSIQVTPTVRNSASFDCPIPDISSLQVDKLGSASDLISSLANVV